MRPETTGTDPATDKVIELALVTFEYCAVAPARLPLGGGKAVLVL
jgi:hypothetical protein